MSKYSAYLQKMATIRNQAQAGQRKRDNSADPAYWIDDGYDSQDESLFEEPDTTKHKWNCRCNDCEGERADEKYHREKDERGM